MDTRAQHDSVESRDLNRNQAMQNKKSKSGNKAGRNLAIGAGVAAVGTAAYLLLGPNGKKNQQKVKAWAGKAKSKATVEIKKAKKAVATAEKLVKKYINKTAPKVKKVVKKAVKKAVKKSKTKK